MIRGECFVRRHFWIEKGRKYHSLFEDESGISVKLQWEKESLHFVFAEESTDSFHVASPEYQKGDALLLFFDTRPGVKSRTFGRHCHEFLVLPEAVEGIFSKEITKFRGYETRPLASDNAIVVLKESHKRTREYSVKVPLDILFGWEDELQEWSFALTYFSHGKEPVHFPITKSEPEKTPYVWPIIHIK